MWKRPLSGVPCNVDNVKELRYFPVIMRGIDQRGASLFIVE